MREDECDDAPPLGETIPIQVEELRGAVAALQALHRGTGPPDLQEERLARHLARAVAQLSPEGVDAFTDELADFGPGGILAWEERWLRRLEDRLEEYRKVVEAAPLAPTTRRTYLRHAFNFIRWLRSDFQPGQGA